MKLFISWSKPQSKFIAEAFHRFIGDCLQNAEPFVSSHDIDAGANWPDVLRTQLRETGFGVLCLTKENLKEPWLLFEAGAISNSLDAGIVCPYLYGLKATDLTWPLAQFNANVADATDPAGTRKVVNAIHKAMKQRGEKQIEHDAFERQFARCWRDYEALLKNVPPIEELKEEEKPTFDTRKALEEILAAVRSRPTGADLPSKFSLRPPSRLRAGIDFHHGPLDGQRWVTASDTVGGEIARAIYLSTSGFGLGERVTLEYDGSEVLIMVSEVVDGKERRYIADRVHAPVAEAPFIASYFLRENNTVDGVVAVQAYWQSPQQ